MCGIATRGEDASLRLSKLARRRKPGGKCLSNNALPRNEQPLTVAGPCLSYRTTRTCTSRNTRATVDGCCRGPYRPYLWCAPGWVPPPCGSGLLPSNLRRVPVLPSATVWTSTAHPHRATHTVAGSPVGGLHGHALCATPAPHGAGSTVLCGPPRRPSHPRQYGSCQAPPYGPGRSLLTAECLPQCAGEAGKPPDRSSQFGPCPPATQGR